MESVYQPQEHEEKIYASWEKGGYFIPKIQKDKKPFTILLPPPNANDPLHMGHAMYVVEDIMVRFHRMLGEPTLWLPGTDHAGNETQFVFEKALSREGKSRFDFDRNTLYQKIADFVEKNRGIAKEQLKKLGFSLDWTREKFTLDPEILKTVLSTFRKLYDDGLIYRAQRIVNYCPFCGTAFSDLEVIHIEKDEFLYFLDYGPIQIATTRPETIFVDVAVAVNPKDKRYQKLIGQKAIVPLVDREVPIIPDEAVDPNFGTGALKITPGHDPVDFEIGQRHGLETMSCIDSSGQMINVPPEICGLYPKEAREKTLALLEKEGKVIKTEPLKHSVGICYRCKNTIEPLLSPQWYIKILPLAKPAIEAVEKNQVKFFPPRFKKIFLDWMRQIRDWNISRQVVWGPRIPAWYCLDCSPKIKINFLGKNNNAVSGLYEELKEKYPFEEIKNGLQTLSAPVESEFLVAENGTCPHCQGSHLLQETDTFDTWFSSGQWPLTTLGYPEAEDFKYFYPTSVLDTMWDILFFWVARMIMFGLYLAKDVPFRVVHMHSRVLDPKRQKMSKSKGNVIDPIDMAEKYGADALRMVLVFGTAPASDIVVSEEKIKAMRNFANKIWNIGRYLVGHLEKKGLFRYEDLTEYQPEMAGLKETDRQIIKELNEVISGVTQSIEKYHFGLASEQIYEFLWHRLADWYIEETKERVKAGEATPLSVLRHVYLNCLKLLHPFMPFVTETIWQEFPRKDQSPLIVAPWPKA